MKSSAAPVPRATPAVPRQVTDARAARSALRAGAASTNAQHVVQLQREAGNAAVSALIAAKLKSPSERASVDLDDALKELKKSEPAIDTVERGLKAAKAAGVAVELEGPKPPASALAVTVTGFGPGSVAPKKPVPAPKPVAPVSPLGKASAKAPKPQGAGKARGPQIAPSAPSTQGAVPAGPGALSGDNLLEPPAPPTSVKPEDDPAFAAVTSGVTSVGKAKKAHPSSASKAKEAQDASLPPTDDIAGQAKAAKADTMDAQRPGTFDKKAFIAAVKAAIEAKSPKTLEEADDYKESGKAKEVKGDVKGLVTSGKEGQAKDIETATEAAPDTSKAVAKPVTPMPPETAGQAGVVPAQGAAPKPAPPEQLNLAAGPHEANQELANADVSESQLAQSNEPDFQQALADKKTAAQHASAAPAEYRKQEANVIQQSKAEASATTGAGLAGMHATKGAALAKLVEAKAKTKTKDETKRAGVTAKIQQIFAAAEADVKKILDGIDPKVESAFEKGEAAARATFESFVSAKMSAYKKDRYSGWLGGLRWAKDKLVGMPSKVNEFYVAGRELYLKEMDRVIGNVADIVGGDLNAAKQRIASGRAEIATYVKSLPADLQKVGSEASSEINDKFEQLESDVQNKQESVVDTLATKYVESRKGLDERIEELQAENRGLVDKAISALKAVVQTIRQLAAMLTGVLARAAGVVGDIIKAPVRFLGYLIEGVKGGILMFKDMIGTHLKKGLMGWLFGALAEGGVELPSSFDIKGIVKFLASLFGLTWANIRNRLVKQIGLPAMEAAEKGVSIFQTLIGQGVAGLWDMLLEKLGDLKDMILTPVMNFVKEKIFTAGLTWLISLLNPAAAFVKACKLIYDIVMFFVTNAERIAKFVNTVLDSVADVVRGNVSAVVNKINDVLGQMVPILIGFLASAIGLGGIGQKIREIVETLRKPVNKALDFVIKTGLKLAGPIIRGLKGLGAKAKAKFAAGKAYVKGKVASAKAKIKSKVAQGRAALLRLLRKGFSADGKAHQVFVNPQGKVLIASGSGFTADQHAQGARAAAAASQRTDMYPSIEELRAMSARHEAQIAAIQASETRDVNPNDPRNARFLSAIEQIATLARGVWTAIHYGGDPGEATTGLPKGLGDIKAHSSQMSPRPNLESEHVLPRRWLSNVLEHVLHIAPLNDRQYNQMTTILIYKGAADLKTEGSEGDNTGLRNLLTGEEGIGETGPAVVTRVDLTMRAISADHESRSRTHSVAPTRAQVQEAAGRQMSEVVRFVRENAGAKVKRGSDFEGSSQLVAKATELVADANSPRFDGSAKYWQGRMTAWIREHSADAPAATRTQVVAACERLQAERARRSS